MNNESRTGRWRNLISRLAVDVDWEVGVKVMRLCQALALGEGGGGGDGGEGEGVGGAAVLFSACASEALVGGMSSADKPVRVCACQGIVEIVGLPLGFLVLFLTSNLSFPSPLNISLISPTYFSLIPLPYLSLIPLPYLSLVPLPCLSIRFCRRMATRACSHG